MGNIVCCEQKSSLEEIESSEEVYIQKTIELISRKMVSTEKLYKIMKNCFSIDLIDIDGLPLSWIQEYDYNIFISKIFNNEIDPNILSYVKLTYNNIKNISVKDYFDKFHLLLIIWLIGMATPRTLSQEKKIFLIKNIIIKCNKYITFKTFSKFLTTFLEIMLVEVTYNFGKHNLEETNILLNDVYNNLHVNEYRKWLCWKMGNIVIKNKNNIALDTRAINNEFIKDEHLDIFFKKYSFLLWRIDLRKNFYNKYSK